MVEVITLEDLCTPEELGKPSIINFEDYNISFDEIENDLIDIMVEEVDIFEIVQQYTTFETICVASKELEISTEGEKWEKFKSVVKQTFFKIVEFIKKIILFVIRVLTWPFRMIAKLFSRKNLSEDLINTSVYVTNSTHPIESSIDKLSNSMEEICETNKNILHKIEPDLKDMNAAIAAIEKAYSASPDHNNIQSMIKSHLMSRNNGTMEFIDVSKQALQVILKDIDPHKISGKECIRSLENVLNHLSTVYDNINDVKKVNSELEQLSKKISILSSKIEHASDDSFTTMPDEMRHIIHKILNVIRLRVAEVSNYGINVAKYFSKIDPEISNINKIAGIIMRHPDVDQSKVIDSIGDIQIIASDDLVMSQGGAVNNFIYSADTEFSIDDRLTDAEINSGNSYIAISTVIASWKDTHPKWYRFLIGHEYGHLTHLHGLDNSKTNDRDINESMSDQIGIGLTEPMTKAEYMEFKAAMAFEHQRLHRYKYHTAEKNAPNIVKFIERDVGNHMLTRFDAIKQMLK